MNVCVNLGFRFEGEGEGEEEIAKHKKSFLSSEGKSFWMGGTFQCLLLGLKTFSDFAFEVKVDAVKVEVTI